VQEINPGDVIWTPPSEKHWHCAKANMSLIHIAIQEALNGKVVDWMEEGRRRALSDLLTGELLSQFISPKGSRTRPVPSDSTACSRGFFGAPFAGPTLGWGFGRTWPQYLVGQKEEPLPWCLIIRQL
jgi:hypothetical protein